MYSGVILDRPANVTRCKAEIFRRDLLTLLVFRFLPKHDRLAQANRKKSIL